MFIPAANLSMMFGEYPFEERFAAAAKCGFKAVELLWPYEIPKKTLKRLLNDNDLTLALFNTPGGDVNKGQWGRAALPGFELEARQDIDLALEYAEFSGCRNIHVMAAVTQGLDQEQCLDVMAKNLEYACNKAKTFGAGITIEALCPEVKMNYLYSSQFQTLKLVNKLNLENLKLQYDFFHAQMVDGAVTKFLTANILHVGHIQIASVPDRHEFDHGELDGAYCLDLLLKLGYQGYVGLEYHPLGKTEDGIGFIKNYF